jgi:hypothetical protein
MAVPLSASDLGQKKERTTKGRLRGLPFVVLSWMEKNGLCLAFQGFQGGNLIKETASSLPIKKEIGGLKMSPKVTGGGLKFEQRLDQCV